MDLLHVHDLYQSFCLVIPTALVFPVETKEMRCVEDNYGERELTAADQGISCCPPRIYIYRAWIRNSDWDAQHVSYMMCCEDHWSYHTWLLAALSTIVIIVLSNSSKLY